MSERLRLEKTLERIREGIFTNQEACFCLIEFHEDAVFVVSQLSDELRRSLKKFLAGYPTAEADWHTVYFQLNQDFDTESERDEFIKKSEGEFLRRDHCLSSGSGGRSIVVQRRIIMATSSTAG